VQLKVSYVVVAFLGYELIAYLINRSVWQKAVATGDYSGQMPFDFLGQMIGYGGPAGGTPPDSSGASVSLPSAVRPALPIFTPAPIPAPNPNMPPDILSPDPSTPPYVTWPGGA
jgi:hypothetical protein